MILKLRHVLLFALVGAGLAIAISYSLADVTRQEQTSFAQVATHQFFATSSTDVARSTSTSATSTGLTPFFDANGRLDSGYADIRGASKVTMEFVRSGSPDTGQSVFSVEVSNDASNWYDFNKLVGSDISATATSSLTMSSTTPRVNVSLDLSKDSFNFLRCIVVEVTDGTHACAAHITH